MKIGSLELTLVRQDQSVRWEACEGCPAPHDPFTKGTLCQFLSTKANRMMGGFDSCGGGSTWRLAMKMPIETTTKKES